MVRHVLCTLFAAMFFIKLNPMTRDSPIVTKNLYIQEMYGDLQARLYKELDTPDLELSVNATWHFVTSKAVDDLSPIMLYFTFRTIFNLPEYQRCPQSIETAWTSLMAFKIMAYIDADVCVTFNFGGYPKWVFEEFSKKLKKRILTFNNSLKMQAPDGPSKKVTFENTLETVFQMFSIGTFLGNNPAWICLCTKPKCSYIGLWADTIDFINVPEALKFKFAQARDMIGARRQQLLECMLSKIKLLILDKNKSNDELWDQFLSIRLDC